MELITAMKIIRALQQGKSPQTEEALLADSICLQQDVKEALTIALEKLADAANRMGRQQNLPPNLRKTVVAQRGRPTDK